MFRQAGRWARLLLGAVSPRTCPGCGAAVEHAEQQWCERCAVEVGTLIAADYCPACALSIGPWAPNPGYCPACQRGPRLTNGIVRVGPYRGIFRRLIRRAKFSGRGDLAQVCAHMLAARLQSAPWFTDVDLLIPVPTHWTHRLDRGNHLAQIIADALAESCRVPAASVLRRTRGGPHQYELGLGAREGNVNGVFAARRGVNLRNLRVCIIDDISTTGATLAEVRRVLRRAGARSVFAAIIAKGGNAAAAVLASTKSPAQPLTAN
jgi:predicted amidophosphoribosyltransferase